MFTDGKDLMKTALEIALSKSPALIAMARTTVVLVTVKGALYDVEAPLGAEPSSVK
jgi:hypothetical protein